MQFQATQDQQLIQASALDWLARHHDFRARAASVHRDGGAPEVWAAWAELGWLALGLPEAHGGIEADPLTVGVLQQAMGRHLTVAPYQACVLQAARLIALAGTPAQQAQWLPAVASGQCRLALAHAEAGEHWPWAPRATTAHRDGEGWRLTGHKTGVDAAVGAALWLVSAQEGEHTSVWLLPPDTPGIAVDAYDTTDGARAADLRLQGVWLPDSARLGHGVDTQAALHQVLAEGWLARCWWATGALQAALEQTTQYTQQRRQFGQALADFQVVQHRLAEMAVQATEAQAACELAAMRLAREPANGPWLAAMARSKVARAARYVAEQAVQLHGAMGVCEELPIAATFRALLAFAQRDGELAEQAARLGAWSLDSGAHAQSATLGA